MMGKHAIRWKIFVSLIHGQPSNDDWKQEGINADAETEVFAILCCSKFVALWFIFKGRRYTHWVEHQVSLGLNLSCGIRVTGFGANQPVIWGGWGGGCVWTAHPILPTLQWPFFRSAELESHGSTTITLESKEVEAVSDFGSISPPVSRMQQPQTSHQWDWAWNVVSPSQWNQIWAVSISI